MPSIRRTLLWVAAVLIASGASGCKRSENSETPQSSRTQRGTKKPLRPRADSRKRKRAKTGTDAGKAKVVIADAAGATADAGTESAEGDEANKDSGKWPLWRYESFPPNRRVELPPGGQPVSLAVGPKGDIAVVAVRAGGRTTLHASYRGGTLEQVKAPEMVGRRIEAISFSHLTEHLYVLSHGGNESRVQRFEMTARTRLLKGGAVVYKSKAMLRRLVVPFLRYDGHERIFFAEKTKVGYRILSVRADGTRPYALSGLRESRANDDEERQKPNIFKAGFALPLSIHPTDGTLIWADGKGRLSRVSYASNWGKSKRLGQRPSTVWQWSPNGYLAALWHPGRPGVRFVDPKESLSGTAAEQVRFTAAPVFFPNGRALLGPVRTAKRYELVTAPAAVPLAAVRYLPDLALSPGRREELARRGIAFTATNGRQIYEPYERLRYDACHRNVLVPIFASIDGFLEVLHAGFQAVFVLAEQHLSLPRLGTFLTRLNFVADAAGLGRVARIANVALQILKGSYRHPEAKLVKAEGPAKSRLHTVRQREPIDFGDFKPRGPYTASNALKHYFRAFKYINLLQLADAELAALQRRPSLVRAWRRWLEVQSPYLSGSRHQGLFDEPRKLAKHVRADCLPSWVLRRPRRVFPLSWGIDSEILESTVMRRGVAPDCSVPGRWFPSGLDLVNVLGSIEARRLQRPDYARWPGLQAAHKSLRARFGGDLPKGKLPFQWLHLLRLIAGARYVPEGLSATLWRRRLIQTALASWTNFRHTTVLVSAIGGAECGDDFRGFERLTREPVRGTVDPLPEAWDQVALMLRTLTRNARGHKALDAVSKVLGSAAKTAAGFASMARRQMKGTPLSQDDYATIQKFAGEVEHPFKLLKSAGGREEDMMGWIKMPEPMTKVVDIHRARGKSLHAAVGPPLSVVVLLGDRGILVPSSGAVFSYYEVLSPNRLNDEDWRKRLKDEKPPQWAPPRAPVPKEL